MPKAKCTDCRYCITEDNGYSNYTVMGTDVDCLQNRHPKFPMDLGWQLPPELSFAETCSLFRPGDSVHVDCDQEEGAYENYSDDPEIKELLKKYGG